MQFKSRRVKSFRETQDKGDAPFGDQKQSQHALVKTPMLLM